MVVGQDGAHGRLVINPAEQAFKSVLGAARNRLQHMAGKRAMDIRGKVVSATRTRAPVRTTLWLYATLLHLLNREDKARQAFNCVSRFLQTPSSLLLGNQ